MGVLSERANPGRIDQMRELTRALANLVLLTGAALICRASSDTAGAAEWPAANKSARLAGPSAVGMSSRGPARAWKLPLASRLRGTALVGDAARLRLVVQELLLEGKLSPLLDGHCHVCNYIPTACPCAVRRAAYPSWSHYFGASELCSMLAPARRRLEGHHAWYAKA